MNLNLKATFALLLALSAASIGVWAEFWPQEFFRSFPVSGHSWVSGLGPYNEHLVRDFGGLYLAMAVATSCAIKANSPEAFRSVGAAWLTFAVLHLVFHLHHLDVFTTPDVVGNVVVLGGQLLLALALLVPSRTAHHVAVAP